MAKIAEYPLDEGTGTAAADSVASYDGTLDGSISWASGGVKGSAYGVSPGATSKVHIPDVLTVSIGTNFGASAWVRRTAGSSARHAIFSPEFNYNSFEFCLCCANGTADTFSLDYGAAWVAGYAITASSTFSLNTWYHLAATARFSSANISDCGDNGSGAIRVTANSHGFTTGRAVRIRNVAGTTEANGAWSITVIDGNTFDLDGSTFANTYTSGGTAYVGEVEFWVDSVSQGVSNLDTTVMGAGDGGDDWSIGAQEDNYIPDAYAFQFTGGKIDLVSLYNSALDQTEVNSLYGAGPGGASPVVSLTASTASIAENGGVATIYATLDATASASVTVGLSASGVASSSSDYSLSTTSITIASGQTSGSISATAISDSVYEGNEAFTVAIASVTGGGASASSVSSTAVTIIDDDSAPTVTISASPSTISENGGASVVTAVLSNASYQNVDVNFSFSGTATNNSDYTRSGTSLTITAGNTSGSISITAIDDVTVETSETVIVDVSSVTNGTENGTQQVTITITSEDTVKASLTRSSDTLSENGGTASIIALLDATASEAVSVVVSLSGTATDGVDYSISSYTISIPSGTSGSVVLTAINDNKFELDETVTASIASIVGGGVQLTSPSTAVFTIIESLSAPTVSLASNRATIQENGQSAILTAALSNLSYQDVTIGLNFAGTATLNTDYTRSTNSIIVPAGQSSGSASIATLNGVVNDPNETVIVSLGTITNGSSATNSAVTVTIVPIPASNGASNVLLLGVG